MPESPSALSARLDPFDWIVIALYILGIVAVGWWFSRRNENASDYLVGGRTMNPIAVGLSFFVAIFSTITYLALPGEIIRYGPVIFAGLLSYPFVYVLVGWFLIPAFMRLNVNSGYELLESRLGVAPRMLGVSLFLLMRLMWMAVITYATVDKAIVPLTGLPPAATPLLCIALAAVAILYGTLGGLKAIVTVDVAQACLLFGGVAISLTLISIKLGGVDGWWPEVWPAHWPEAHLANPPAGGRSIVAAFFAILAWYTCTSGSDQMAVQRYLATRDVKAARKMLGVSLIAGALIQLALGGLGLALLGYVAHNPSWVQLEQVTGAGADQLFPSFIASVLPAGLAGLILAGLLTEAINSLSSGLNAASAVISTDFLGRFRRRLLSPSAELRQLRWISLLAGCGVVLVSVLVSYVQGNLLEVTYKVVNLLTAPLFSLFFFAIFIRWATTFGALVGTGAGLVVTIVVNFWREISVALNFLFDTPVDLAPPISFLWGTPLSILFAAIVGMLASLLPGGPTAAERAAASVPARARETSPTT